MQGNENWKWGVVFILLAIFLVTANQAYKHVINQENFEPPDDYLKGDSWDVEQQEKAADVPSKSVDWDDNSGGSGELEDTDDLVNMPSDIDIKDDIDWDKL